MIKNNISNKINIEINFLYKESNNFQQGDLMWPCVSVW